MLDKALCDEAIDWRSRNHLFGKVAIYYWDKGPLPHYWNGSLAQGTKGYHKEYILEGIPYTQLRLDSFIEQHGLPDRWGFSHIPGGE